MTTDCRMFSHVRRLRQLHTKLTIDCRTFRPCRPSLTAYTKLLCAADGYAIHMSGYCRKVWCNGHGGCAIKVSFMCTDKYETNTIFGLYHLLGLLPFLPFPWEIIHPLLVVCSHGSLFLQTFHLASHLICYPPELYSLSGVADWFFGRLSICTIKATQSLKYCFAQYGLHQAYRTASKRGNKD